MCVLQVVPLTRVYQVPADLPALVHFCFVFALTCLEYYAVFFLLPPRFQCVFHLFNRITAKPAAAFIAASSCGIYIDLCVAQLNAWVSFLCVARQQLNNRLLMRPQGRAEQGRAGGQVWRGRDKRCRQSVCLFRWGKCKKILRYLKLSNI